MLGVNTSRHLLHNLHQNARAHGPDCRCAGCIDCAPLEHRSRGLPCLLLLVAAFGLFALEFWVPSFGLLSLFGTLALIVGGILLFERQELDFGIAPGLLVGTAISVGLCAFGISLVAVRVFGTPPAHSVDGAGEKARVLIGGEGEGWGEFQGERWRAEPNNSPLAPTLGRCARLAGL